jgi:5-methylcytosine-specific restriction enzyme A
MKDSCYVYKKEVDWSLLHEGLSIPLTIQVVFQKNIEKFLKRGQSKDIYIALENKTYKAKLKNQTFNVEQYGDRADILQIRFSPQSELACEFRKLFDSSYQFIKEERDKIMGQGKKPIKIPTNKKEFLAIYTTPYEDTYYVECITVQDMEQFDKMIVNEDEELYEKAINLPLYDHNAGVERILRDSKIRKLNRSIGDSLKQLYEYKCQICGQNFGSPYDANIVEAHHNEAID